MAVVSREEFDELKKAFDDLRTHLGTAVVNQSKVEVQALTPASAEKEPKAPKKTRAPTVMNIFMEKELKRIKQSEPTLNQKQVFKRAVENWRLSPERKVAIEKKRESIK